MRWIVTIVMSLCLCAAAGERPDPRHGHGPDSPELTLAGNLATICAPVRRAGSARHVRLDAFVASDLSASHDPPEVGIALAATTPPSPAHQRRARNVSIRGPPRG